MGAETSQIVIINTKHNHLAVSLLLCISLSFYNRSLTVNGKPERRKKFEHNVDSEALCTNPVHEHEGNHDYITRCHAWVGNTPQKLTGTKKYLRLQNINTGIGLFWDDLPIIFFSSETSGHTHPLS